MSVSSPKTDAEWQAESDADTLDRAADVLKDKKRKGKAVAAAKKKAETVARVSSKLKEVFG